MTFQDAKDLAIEFGAKLPKFDHTSPVAQCWIDRIAMLPHVHPTVLVGAIEFANYYAG